MVKGGSVRKVISMSEEQAAYNVKPISLDKKKLLEWLKVEIESCEFIGDERDRTIRLECMKIVERINEGLFDSSTISTETQWKIKLRVEELLKEKAQEQLNEAVELLKEVERLNAWPCSEPFAMKKIRDFLSSLSQETEPNQTSKCHHGIPMDERCWECQ
jgi:hypothetical protein